MSMSSSAKNSVIQVFRPNLGMEELDALQQIFKTGWVGRGPAVAAFERTFEEFIGAAERSVITTNSCTEGLFQSLALLGIGEGDEVVLPSISFVGAANAVMASGAKPVFCDVHPRSLNPSVEDIEVCLGARTKAVLLLHYGGVPGDLLGIVELLDSRGITLIEDAALSVGSSLQGKACGTFGSIGLWSFDSMKVIAAGDGGAMYLQSVELRERAQKLLYLGLSVESGFLASTASRWWEFDVSEPARRSVWNDIGATLASVQLKNLSKNKQRRSHIKEVYDRELLSRGDILGPPHISGDIDACYSFYWIQMPNSKQRDKLARFLREQNIYTTFRYMPLHQIPLYKARASLPKCEQASLRTLCIPFHHALSDSEVDRVVSEIQNCDAGL